MKRLIFIVEGDSEKEFIKMILKPFLVQKNINDISVFKIKKSGGGISKYSHLKNDILTVIHQKDVLVTTMVDLYGLPNDFPGIKESSNIDEIEAFFENDITGGKSNLKKKFIPYIQKYEFEALVFACYEGIDVFFEKNLYNSKKLNNLMNEFPKPEEINDQPTTSPSKRLKSLIKGYDKVVHGNMIISEIGINVILKKCPHFNSWVSKIIHKF